MTVKAILKQHETRAPRSLLEADALVILEVRITVHVCFRVGSTHLPIDVYRTMSYGTRVALSAQVKETRSTLRARQTSP